MVFNILLTSKLKETLPNSIKIIENFGETKVMFPPVTTDDDITFITGDNAILEGEQNDIISWLKPFKSVAVGYDESPQFEKFRLVHIKENIKLNN